MPEAGKVRAVRASTAKVKEDMSEQVRLEQMQVELREQKLEEMRKRFEAQGSLASSSSRPTGPVQLGECEAYASSSSIAGRIGNRKCVQVDVTAEALLVPMKGALVPFHCRTIKNMSRLSEDGIEYLRINFFVPGVGKAADDFPRGGPDRIYVKELVFKSKKKENFDYIMASFKEVQKKMKEKDTLGEVKKSSSEGMIIAPLRQPPLIRDVNMRPVLGAGSKRSVGTIEAHANGFRFSSRGTSEKVEIFYSQIREAIYQPCETGSLLIVLHLHLKEEIVIGKKRTRDVQFYTEVAPQTEDLSMRRAGNAHDPDEILEEQREQELKERLNKTFLEFSKKVEAIPDFGLAFEIPAQALSFTGVPNKGTVQLFPCTNALVAVQEWPPFCLDMRDVDIVVFERAMLSTREFDIAFVLKDYNHLPVRVTMVPSKSLDKIKSWLADMKMIWYSVSMNMQWSMVMQEIRREPNLFMENNGWDGWFGAVGSDNDDDDEAEKEEESDFQDEDDDDDSDDEEGNDDDDDEDFDMEEDDDEDAELDDDEDSGESWDALERQAEKSDRRSDQLKRGQEEQPHAAGNTKRPRRR